MTFNLRDFPAAALAPLGIEAQHPGAFVAFLADTAPSQVLTGAQACLGRLTNPPIGVAAFLKSLRAAGFAETATLLDGKLS